MGHYSNQKRISGYLGVLIVLCCLQLNAFPQETQANYDESRVPAYTLPDPLILSNGEPVTDAITWWEQRRPEILNLFESEIFGKTPTPLFKPSFQLISEDTGAMQGTIRKEIHIFFTAGQKERFMTLLLILPKSAKPVPVFLGLNFDGNHTISNDPGITISTTWVAAVNARGADSLAWPVQQITDRGFGLATLYYGDIDPDFDDGFQNGIHPLFYSQGQSRPGAGEWGSIGAWAWGLSRAMDYLETDQAVDPKKVAVIGHSRLGKTALWAGAQDPRFAMVISNNSGCGGAALSKRIFGETVGTINKAFPHWFCANFRKYNNNEAALPVDQHMLIALIAPRPVYVASAAEDLWADPLGEFLGALHANPVYKLLGTEGLSVGEIPPLNTPVMSTIGYHIRTGPHAITGYDWNCYLGFAEKHFGLKP